MLSPEIERNQAKWESQHITHYRMSLNLLGYGYNYSRMPLTVEVKDGEVITVVDARGETVSPKDHEVTVDDYPNGFTIPGMFSYADRTCGESPPAMKVSFNPVLGYPTTIYVDPYTEPCCQDFTIEVRDFEVLP